MTTLRPYILIVDDDPDMRWMATLTLRQIESHGLKTAINGADALNIIASCGVPAVVVTDLRMPVMDGFQLILALRADERLRGMPIIVASNEPNWPSAVTESRVRTLTKMAMHQELLPLVKEAIDEP